jgi:hypothetical protein
MDPPSIVTSSAAQFSLWQNPPPPQFHLRHQNVGTIESLHSDVLSLSQLLEDISTVFARSKIKLAVMQNMDNFNGYSVD